MKELTDEELLGAINRVVEERREALRSLSECDARLSEMNRRLVDSERYRTGFLSNMRNELKNPLASLIALAREMCSGHGSVAPKYPEMARMILSEVLSLEFQINNFIAVAEFEAGDVTVDAVAVDATAMVESCLKSLDHLVKERQIEVIRDYGAQTWITTDPVKLHVITMNLLGNAVVFNRRHGTIHVSMHVDGGIFLLSVTDSGIGICGEDYRRIFDRFVQLDAGSSKSYRGTGLGLSAARAAAEALGGGLTLQSKLGTGSTFGLIIPSGGAVDPGRVCCDGAEFFDDKSNAAAEKEF